MILLAAVVVAFVVGMIDDASDGWIESVAILTAVVIVSQVIYQLPFRSLHRLTLRLPVRLTVRLRLYRFHSFHLNNN